MAHILLQHTEAGCPAYHYCLAIEAYGVPRDQQGECFFEIRDSGIEVSPEIEKALSLNDENATILRSLVNAAIKKLATFVQMGDQAEKKTLLLDLREAVFSARMALWSGIIKAAREKRPFTDVELSYYQKNIDDTSHALQKEESRSSEEACLQALFAHDRKLQDCYGLVFDEKLIEDIDQLVSNISTSRPTLIVGDKGIAKTQIARFVMGLYNHEPIIISVKGDMMSDELIGKLAHDKELGTFVFQEGLLLKAMRGGLPVLLDEINFGDQAIIARLQDILLKKPGDHVLVQESDGEPIAVEPGFAVFATANEASIRYRHREVLDPAIRDRFDIIMRTYPDITGDPITDTPRVLLRLAMSSIVDIRGMPSEHIDLGTLESFVRLSRATQYLYAVPAKDVRINFAQDRIESVILEEDQPLMTDCITPRTMSSLLADCSGGNLPRMNLGPALVEKTLRSLDQAGSSLNYELATQLTLLLFGSPNAFAESRGSGSGIEYIDDVFNIEEPMLFSGLSKNARNALVFSAQ